MALSVLTPFGVIFLKVGDKMRDMGGIILIILTLLGAIRGRHLPEIIPIAILILAAILLIYSAFIIKSKMSIIYTGLAWVAFVWYVGIILERAGVSIFVMVPYTLMFILTPAVMFLHWRVYRRFNPVPVRGLHIEPSEGDAPEFLEKIKEKMRELFASSKKEEANDQEELKPLVFDLGRKIDFDNR